MQRKWRRDWERSKASQNNSQSKQNPFIKPLKTLVKGILPSVAAAGIMLYGMTGVYASTGVVLPTDGQIVAGSGIISQTGNTLTVNQATNNMIANWKSFSIGAGGTVEFIQPNANSVALNRVLGNEASSIYGNLIANGKVFLVNPNGVLFAPGAQVNVGGIVASTLNISDSDFLAGNYKFSGDGGTVTNQGTITAADGGYVALLAPEVINDGIIVAKQGTVALGAGQAVTLDMQGDGLLSLAVDQAAVNASVANHNLIQADGGQVIMAAKAADTLAGTVINNSGIIQATSISNVNGVILLDGGANGTVVNSGTLDASGKDAGQTGGTVKVLGDTVILADGAKVDVSGANGGGTALIGGNTLGQGPEQNAAATTVAATATINADALTGGNGGQVVVWADNTTNYYGSISARGGANGGDGGSVETSGKQTLTVSGSVNAGAANGTAGTWLLDPTDYTVDATAAASFNSALNGGTDVVIQSSMGSTGNNGDIFVNAPLTWTTAGKLTLSADRDVNVNADITASGDNAGLTITPGAGGAYTLGRGNKITLTGVNPSLTIAGQSYTVINDHSTGGALQALQDINTNSAGYYALGTDIDASATSTWNSGAGFTPISGFTGIFDGGGHVISGLYNYGSSIGLFGSMDGAAAIRNVGLEDVNMLLTGGSGGALVGSMNQTSTWDGSQDHYFTPSVTNCYATGTIKAGAITDGQITGPAAIFGTGGLVGSSTGIITNSYSTVSLSINTSTNNIGYGGLVGSGSATITNCYNTGAVDVTFTRNGNINVGGLAGNAGIITNSYNAGAVTLTSTTPPNNTSGRLFWRAVGGLVGSVDGDIKNSYNTGSVTVSAGGALVGGLAGRAAANIDNSYSTGLISVTPLSGYPSYAGGLVGHMGMTRSNETLPLPTPGTITNSYWDTETSGIADPAQGAGNIASCGGVTGLTTADMMNSSSYSGWTDFPTIWRIYDGYTYPLLKAFLTPITVTANAAKTYDGTPFTGGVVATYSIPSAVLNGSLSWGGDAQGAVDVGTYTITPAGLYSGQQGYDITFVDGALTINPPPSLPPAEATMVEGAIMTAVITNGANTGAGSNIPQPGITGRTNLGVPVFTAPPVVTIQGQGIAPGTDENPAQQ